MKLFNENLLMLILSFIMVLSSVQGAYAAANKCLMTEKEMQSQMHMVNMNSYDLQQTAEKTGCCVDHKCTTSHCVNSSVVTISSNDVDGITYKSSSVFVEPNTILVPFYSSSVFRPPKI